jgi:hypothetical protein
VLLLTPGDPTAAPAGMAAFKDLPRRTRRGLDPRRTLLQAVTGALQMELNDRFPLTLYLSRNGGILYSTAGYRIGVGDELLTIIRKEEMPVF